MQSRRNNYAAHEQTSPCLAYGIGTTFNDNNMHLTPKEEKLKLLTMGLIAERRLSKGQRLNYPESVACMTSWAREGAREGKSVEEVMHDAANVLTKSQVMDGVADMIGLLQVEAVFTYGSRLVSIHQPVK